MTGILILLLACGDKSDDSAEDTPTHVDGGAADGGTPLSDGGGTTGPCTYDWRGAPCSSEWSGLYNCDECGQTYVCKGSGDGVPWPLSWAESDVACECVDLETGAILEHVDGCEDAGK